MAGVRQNRDVSRALEEHQARLVQCTRCPLMTGPPVVGHPAVSPVMLVGQAPGAREVDARRPFAWTAGKTLFDWFDRIGLDEQAFRQKVYMAAVCRCFPGKTGRGGDRLPNRREIENCAPWMEDEFRLLQPRLIIATGKLAISRFMPVPRLADVVGQQHQVEILGRKTDFVPLPHPSGASTWHYREPGKSLLQQALEQIREHPAWRSLLR